MYRRMLTNIRLLIEMNFFFSKWKYLVSIGDKERFNLPESMPILHMELTQFYFPGDVEFPSNSKNSS